jgi:methionyl-tRNA formyltransferase
MPTKVAVCGEKRVCEACLDFLYERNDVELCAVAVSESDWQADLRTWAAAHGIPVLQGNINGHLSELEGMALDFIFSIQSRHLLRPPILALPRRDCINLHFSLLPRYGGCSPVAWAIWNGEIETGVTLHRMSENFDEGDILAQRTVDIGPDTTARELFDTLGGTAADLFRDSFDALLADELTPCKQDAAKKLYYAAGDLDFERDNHIDWSQPGDAVYCKIRAFTFPPFQLPRAMLSLPAGERRRVTLEEVRRLQISGRTEGEPGRVLVVEDSPAVAVVSGDGSLIRIGKLDGGDAREYFAKNGCRPEDGVFSTD